MLTNAIDASPQGGTVTIRTRLAPEGGVTLAVIDAGKGIDPSIRDRVFEPFFTTKQIGQGTGLGLSIAYGIVQLHGGRIEFESEPDRGTRFTVHLPLGVPRAHVAAAGWFGWDHEVLEASTSGLPAPRRASNDPACLWDSVPHVLSLVLEEAG